MVAREQRARRSEPRPRASEATTRAKATRGAGTAKVVTREPRAAHASLPPRVSRQRKPVELPPVAPCLDLETLQSLDPDDARRHVNDYLYDVMPGEDACAFEAMHYRWELHLVDIEQVRMVRGVQLDPKKVRRYTATLRRGQGFPPLVGLGGEGKRVTDDILLCDGYHRAAAMRRAGIYYAWAWLAVDLWRQPSRAASPVRLSAAAG